MMTIAIALGVALAIALAALAYFFAERSALTAKNTELQTALQSAEASVESAVAENHSFQKQLAVHQQQLSTLDLRCKELAGLLSKAQAEESSLRQANHELQQRIAVANQKQQAFDSHVNELLKRMESTFAASASSALQKQGAQFLELASTKLKGEQATAATEADKQLQLRKKEIEALVTPIQQTLAKYQTELQGIEKARSEAYGSIRQQLERMAQDHVVLRTETGNLVKALHRSEVRGRWGEMQLRRVAELAGMIPNCDFYEQQVTDGADGSQLRPDMVIHLPSDRTIVVDAKAPIDAFLNAIESQDDAQKQTLLSRHAEQIESRVRELAGKRYHSHFKRSPEFVVMFIPGESFLQAAVQVKADLLEKAMEKGIVIATPSTLMALLKTVAQGWREQKIAENAQRISEVGTELHERLRTAVEHIESLGGALEKAIAAYNKFIGTFETRVLVSARKLEDLHTQSAKPLPPQGELEEITTTARLLKAAD